MHFNLLALGCTALIAGCAHRPHTAHGDGHFDDADAWALAFEDPARDDWQKPSEVIAALGLTAQTRIADIGAATGYFPVRFAKVAAMVYGVDIEAAMVEYLTKRAEREGLNNLVAVLGTSTDAKISQPVDIVTVVDTYHHIENRTAYFAALKRSLSPRGHLAIIDFKTNSKLGPPKEMKIAPEQVTRELTEAGYALATQHGFLAEQYFLVFTLADQR